MEWYTKENEQVKIKPSTNDDQNRMLLAKALMYVKDHYRNKVAHKDPVPMTKVEECQKILLQSQYLLWICLYILK